MRRSLVVLIVFGVITVICLLLLEREDKKDSPTPGTSQSSLPSASAQPIVNAQAGDESPIAKKTEVLKLQAMRDFGALLAALQPYGQLDGTRDASVQHRTNRSGSINIEVEVRSATHKGSFIAGPYNPKDGSHENSGLADAALLRLFESLYDGYDTRRNPDAVNSWYQSTGKWSEAAAVGETLRLMEAMKMPTNQVARHRFRASAITVKNPSGNDVRVTPFYTVQMCNATDDDYSYFLGVQFRIGAEPPARVTRWESWPPIKVP
jgi:hypothetical protein